MYESVIVPCNLEYGNGQTNCTIDPRKVIFRNSSIEHITVTVVDPKTGVSAEAMIRKDALPAFVIDHKIE
ncbi:MAG: hypothetical protein A2Y74_09395 [Actinobacteria bacterium RBG_13_63_9]|nr:MAG: hypothetical protein A2Y74_09395 [Actinobacteria bacterium RBG_13_63_9]